MTDHRWVSDTTERYYKEIYCYCRRHVTSEDTAYELTQTVFLRFCEQYRTVERKTVRAWLYRVAKNVCADHYRAEYRTQEWSSGVPVEECEDALAKTDAALEHMEFCDAMAELLGKLTDAERQLFFDRYQRGLSYDAIAEQNGITPTAVRKRCSRMHKKLVKYGKQLL